MLPIFLAIPLLVAAPAPLRIAVLDIKAKAGFDKEVRDIFVEFFQTELRNRGLKVIGKADIESMIGLDKLQSTLGCDSTVCFAEIGGALGADELVTGSIARLDQFVLVTLKRINPKRSEVVAQISKKIAFTSQNSLIDAAAPLAAELFGNSTAPPAASEPPSTSGSVRVRILVDDPSQAYRIEVSGVEGRWACPSVVIAAKPCTLDLPAAQDKLQVTVEAKSATLMPAVFEHKVILHGATDVHVSWVDRKALQVSLWLLTFPSSALLVTALMTIAEPCNQSNSGVAVDAKNCPVAYYGELLLVGAVPALFVANVIAIIVTAVKTGDKSTVSGADGKLSVIDSLRFGAVPTNRGGAFSLSLSF